MVCGSMGPVMLFLELSESSFIIVRYTICTLRSLVQVLSHRKETTSSSNYIYKIFACSLAFRYNDVHRFTDKKAYVIIYLVCIFTTNYRYITCQKQNLRN